MEVDEVSCRLPANSIAHFTNKYKYKYNTNTNTRTNTNINASAKKIYKLMRLVAVFRLTRLHTLPDEIWIKTRILCISRIYIYAPHICDQNKHKLVMTTQGLMVVR